ncbi:MAG: biotin-dependent carboxyltransferase family protein [Pseudomonadota bacterium]
MNLCTVHVPGAFTTVQDLGRFGYQQMGIPVSGALDAAACRVANLLVGNSETAAVLELTITGPKLAFMAETAVALTGAEMGMFINGSPAASWHAHRLKPGDMLEIRQVTRGCRGYLAVSGGIQVPPVMGSRATYVGGALGGFNGRPLKAGDVLPGSPAPALPPPRGIPKEWIPEHGKDILLRVVPGPQDDFFDAGMKTLLSSAFMVTPKADRMGYRLQGPEIRRRADAPASIVSEPSMPGGIQIPADNQPIILLVEQTVGGYAKIATVISTDLPRLAQATPGDTVTFEQITLEAAHGRYREQEDRLRKIAGLFI